MSVMFSIDEIGGVDRQNAVTAGATPVAGWEMRTLPQGQMFIYLSTTGWWGVARAGKEGRIARRRDIGAAVRLAEKLTFTQ